MTPTLRDRKPICRAYELWRRGNPELPQDQRYINLGEGHCTRMVGRQESKVLAPEPPFKTNTNLPRPTSGLYPQKLALGDYITAPSKKGDQSSLPHLQQRTLSDELGEYIMWNMALGGGKVWD